MDRAVEEIEEEIKQLSQDQLKKFRAWYEEFDSAVWDEQIKKDAESGKLDAIAYEAVKDHKAGKSRKI